MSKRLKDAILLAIIIVAAVTVCLLTSATPKPVDTSRPIDCPYQTQIQTCPEMVR